MSAGRDLARIAIMVDNIANEGLVTEHGFSAWIETAGRRVVFDTGQGPALAYNPLWLDVALDAADTLILSHGHFDHTGGIPMVLGRVPTAQVYAHPATTTPRYALWKGTSRSIGMPATARMALESHPATGVHWITQPLEIASNMGLTGPIPRVTDYEDTGGPFFLDAHGTQVDPLADDLALWIRTDQGLVVIVGCSHAGLINTLLHARQQSGEPRLHAVLGGFHLRDAGEPRLERTMDALKELDLDLIVACHCTGEASTAKLKQTFGERVQPGSAGATYTFGGPPPGANR